MRGFVGGQGAGKTKIGAYDLLRRAIGGRHYAIIAPTYKMLRDATITTFREVAEQFGQWRDHNKTDNVIEIAAMGGVATVLCRSSDSPDRLRGPNLSGVWIDEAGLVDHEAYQVLRLRLREGGGNGWITATFTPCGLGHWTAGEFTKDNAFLVRCSTRDNPFLSQEFVDAAYSVYVDALAEQELGGEFVADDDTQKVVPVAWIKAAMAAWDESGSTAPIDAIGVDVARGGRDKTALASRRGTRFDKIVRVPGVQTPDGPSVAALVVAAIKDHPRALACIDVIGIGASAYDHARAAIGDRAFAVNFATKTGGLTDSTGRFRFANLRAFAYWSLRELLDPANKHNARLPPDPELLAELAAPRWSLTSGGIKIESKDEIIKRLGRSPDSADAIACSVLLPPTSGPSGPTRLVA